MMRILFNRLEKVIQEFQTRQDIDIYEYVAENDENK